MHYAALCSAVLQKLRREGIRGLWRASVGSIKRSHSAFDEEFGTDTESIVHLWQLDIDSPNRDDGTRYQPVDPDLIRAAIETLPIGLEDFVFVDLGSGKGRTLLLASEYSFKRVIGVEFSPQLNAIATDNIGKYPKVRCQHVTSTCGDAATYEFPPDNLVIYLYHPFGERVFRQVLQNLEASLTRHEREVYVVYFNPVLASLLDASGFLQRVELPVEWAIAFRNSTAADPTSGGKCVQQHLSS
ncbi:class I SAM-dependent methyltransferase [Bradyrhizobium sp. ARR65]|uniref:class I SAM-dependent methyltransferase n=1 Tax=Bradyrhizobium sp. ARR65 TaxID=1040989 RepID=UPI000464CEAC|nr:class I SAM-dependent methyltransferase [Bradyrhizobium sp. ARR65]